MDSLAKLDEAVGRDFRPRASEIWIFPKKSVNFNGYSVRLVRIFDSGFQVQESASWSFFPFRQGVAGVFKEDDFFDKLSLSEVGVVWHSLQNNHHGRRKKDSLKPLQSNP